MGVHLFRWYLQAQKITSAKSPFLRVKKKSVALVAAVRVDCEGK